LRFPLNELTTKVVSAEIPASEI